MNNYGPRHLRRSVAKANMERAGMTNLNSTTRGKYLGKSKFATHWRKFAMIPREIRSACAKERAARDRKRAARLGRSA